MATEAYKTIKFRAAALHLVETMNEIIEDYQRQGFTLTVRQLYYQLVARAEIENTEQSYNRVTGIVNDARLGGYIDWDAIEDRTREFIRRQRWESGAQILESAARSYHMDMWETQPKRVFVIIEKEALVGVLEGTCRRLDVPLLAARGYPSVSVLREFVQRDILTAKQEIHILHLGDHDPSGIDMTRDLRERIEIFTYGRTVNLKRIALNMNQIREQNPPPNPAKTTDSRFAAYQALHGTESWELDALRPDYLTKLVQGMIMQHIEPFAWQDRMQLIKDTSKRIDDMAMEFEDQS